jgi:hypothetical protein
MEKFRCFYERGDTRTSLHSGTSHMIIVHSTVISAEIFKVLTAVNINIAVPSAVPCYRCVDAMVGTICLVCTMELHTWKLLEACYTRQAVFGLYNK